MPHSGLRLVVGFSVRQGMNTLFIWALHKQCSERQVPISGCSRCRRCLPAGNPQCSDPLPAGVFLGTPCAWLQMQVPAVRSASECRQDVRPKGTGIARPYLPALRCWELQRDILWDRGHLGDPREIPLRCVPGSGVWGAALLTASRRQSHPCVPRLHSKDGAATRLLCHRGL